jgi:hypothetical protein
VPRGWPNICLLIVSGKHRRGLDIHDPAAET